jgi:hypothetical protein
MGQIVNTLTKPTKIEVWNEDGWWRWNAFFKDGSIEHSPEFYLSSRTAKAIARLCYPDTFILVFK